MSDNLTIPDVFALASVIETAAQGAKVARAIGDDVVYGVARHIVKSPDDFGFIGRDTDVRDGYLRVTLRSGLDVAWPVRDLMRDNRNGEFRKYDW